MMMVMMMEGIQKLMMMMMPMIMTIPMMMVMLILMVIPMMMMVVIPDSLNPRKRPQWDYDPLDFPHQHCKAVKLFSC